MKVVEDIILFYGNCFFCTHLVNNQPIAAWLPIVSTCLSVNLIVYLQMNKGVKFLKKL